MRIITTTATRIIITVMIMGGKKKNLPLVKRRKDRKRSRPAVGDKRNAVIPGRERSSRTRNPETSSVAASGFRVRASGAPRNDDAEIFAHTLYRLMTWLSPSYPVGAFSYSSGIEWAVEAGDIKDADSLKRWLTVMTADGSAFCDCVFFRHAHEAVADASTARLHEVAELSAAFIPSKERHLETTAQGRAFIEATRAVWPCEAMERLVAAWDGPVTYPVAVGVTASGHGIAVEPALQAYLHAMVANWISAGVRLVPLGQTDGQRVLAALEPVVAKTIARALKTPLEQVASSALRSDLASTRHETQYTRLFRS